MLCDDVGLDSGGSEQGPVVISHENAMSFLIPSKFGNFLQC
jgi:hypothetical protein